MFGSLYGDGVSVRILIGNLPKYIIRTIARNNGLNGNGVANETFWPSSYSTDKQCSPGCCSVTAINLSTGSIGAEIVGGGKMINREKNEKKKLTGSRKDR